MKYEAVFGDQSLFFDAHRDCEMVGNGHHKVKNEKLMVWNFSEKYWAESHTNKITIAAMRRIIAEPKRWTFEDKKAGRLPEVGCKVDTFIGERMIIGCDLKPKFFAVQHQEDGSMDILHISNIKPIETPEEKAQREEDEFVSLVESKYNHMPNEISFKAGIRAAYRKLKGGE